ncbi:MAG: hypothetical protein CTY19_03650 [Methylomonas sp.]|nr:MAG: hypothetical protein CTY19_03650 [Methylomonas sp.]
MKFNSKLLLPALAVFSGNCQAFDWLFDPRFSATERYTDNLRMQINPTRDNLITTLSPGVLLGYMAENHALNANLNWNELIYHGESELDLSEKIANMNHQFTGERFKTDIAAQYAVQSSINTQLDLDGSGNLQVQVPRTTRSLAPSFTYNFTERNALQLSYNYVDVAFDRTEALANNLGYSDYDNQQLTATFFHTYSQQLTFNFSGEYSVFNSSNNSNTSQNLLLPDNSITNRSTGSKFEQQSTNFLYRGGLQYQYDEQTQLALSAGMRQTENHTSFLETVTFDPLPLGLNNVFNLVNPPATKASGHVFSANLNRKTEWGNFSVSAAQQLNPSSSGNQQQTTNFSGNLLYNLNERWSTALTASYLISEDTRTFVNNIIDNNRTLSTLTPSLRWRWTPEINLDLSYTYRQQDFSFLNDSAIGNNLQLQFSYQPQINRQVK